MPTVVRFILGLTAPHPNALRSPRGLSFAQLGLAAFAVLCAAFAPQPADARVRALLIGVSEYELKKIPPLDGPRNDVVLLWRRLKELRVAPEDIVVLADGVPQGPQFPSVSGLPTLKAIQDELARLAEVSGPDDVVVFFFAGHGVTQIARPGAGGSVEAAGAAGLPEDQVLLPRDAGEYDMDARGTRNGLVDNDLGDMLDRIRAKGAFVWAVVDACHAGSSTRNVASVTERTVDPSVLGIPQPTAQTRGSGAGKFALSRGASKAAAGGLVGFFAVDARSRALERSFPEDFETPLAGSGEARKIGLFTYHLHRALGEGQVASYRELGQRILAAMLRADGIAVGRLPVIEGDLDRALLGSGKLDARRWPAQLVRGAVRLQAGTLHGIAEGSEVALYKEPVGGEPLATAIVRRSEPLTSEAEPPAGSPSLSDAVPAELNDRVFVQLVSAAVEHLYRVAQPADPDGTDLRPLLDRAATAASKAGVRVEITAADDPRAGAWTRVEKGQLLIASSRGRTTADAAAPPIANLPLATATEAVLADRLWRLARAAHLARVGMSGVVSGALGDPYEFSIEAKRVPAAAAKDLAKCDARMEGAVSVKHGEPFPATHHDKLCFFVANYGGNDVALAAFYVEAGGRVVHVDRATRGDARTQMEGCWWRIGARSKGLAQPMPVPMRIITRRDGRSLPLGYEHIVFIAFELAAGDMPPPICHLEQDNLAGAQSRSASPVVGDYGALLSLLQPGEGTRSARLNLGKQVKVGTLVRAYMLDLMESAQ